MTPYLQEVIEWRLYPMHGFFCACSFIVGEFFLETTVNDHGLTTDCSVLLCVLRFTDVLDSTNTTAVYPETMGVPLEEMDAVFGEGKQTRCCRWHKCSLYLSQRNWRNV